MQNTNPEPLQVLFLGNSQISWRSNIPGLVVRLAHSAPAEVPRIVADQVAIGGASLETLWHDGRPAETIARGGWDWVVCNELIYSYGATSAKFREYAGRFQEAVNAVGARLMFFATGETESARLTPEAMYQDCAAMARTCGGRVAGGGMAWLAAWAEQPTLDLHADDRAHPNAAGYYLNACVIFAALTDASPIGLDAIDLPAARAAFLQRVAWQQYRQDRREDH